jgi:hypothetical protein
MGAGAQRHAQAVLSAGRGPGNDFIGDWVVPKADLDREDRD